MIKALPLSCAKMNTKTKKQNLKARPVNIAALPAKSKVVTPTDIIPLTLILSFVAVDFVPAFGAIDVMGAQWFYLTLLNIVAVAFIVLNKHVDYSTQIHNISSNLLTIIFLSFLILAAVSVFFAFNKIEALVCYSRLLITFISYACMTVLLLQRLKLFNILAQIFCIILLLQSLAVLVAFFKDYGSTDLNQLILSLKGNTGNKNILAAALVIKLPFAYYGAHFFRAARKLFSVLAIVIASFTIAILNARAAYLSLTIILLIYLVYCLRTKPLFNKNALKQAATVFFSTATAFITASLVLKNAANMQDSNSLYGNLSERLSSIASQVNTSSHRMPLWRNAVDYIGHHPLMGAGYGNWKIASTTYDKTLLKDFEVSYHVHNDFLEAGAEMGIAGTLLLVSLFACALIYLFRNIRNNSSKAFPGLALISLLMLAVYFIDAFFNFPHERPVMQFFFAFLLALITSSFLQPRKGSSKTVSGSTFSKKLFGLISVFVLLPSLWLTYSTYSSMKAQATINADFEKPTKTFQEVNAALPSVPNLNIYSMPIDAIKANYLFAEKRYDEAVALVNKSYSANPNLPLGDWIKARLYLEKQQLDSALHFANIAFEQRPQSAAIFQALNAINFALKDTSALHQSFNDFVSYRNEAWAWNEYLNYLYDLPHDSTVMVSMVDSALVQFPNDSYLLHKKAFLHSTE